MIAAARPAVFVDKDGTLVHNVPYNVDPALLRFHTGALDALSELAQTGFTIVIVTNQSGVARGHFTLAEFERLRIALLHRLQDEAGIAVAGVYMCPHAPDAQGLPVCPCRKPMPGMLLRAAEELGLDMASSWIVGDTLDDVEAGRRAGCRGILYDSGGETVWRAGPLRVPHARVKTWGAVAQSILESTPRRTVQPAVADLERSRL